jgi:hypothetical protein
MDPKDWLFDVCLSRDEVASLLGYLGDRAAQAHIVYISTHAYIVFYPPAKE